MTLSPGSAAGFTMSSFAVEHPSGRGAQGGPRPGPGPGSQGQYPQQPGGQQQQFVTADGTTVMMDNQGGDLVAHVMAGRCRLTPG
jgi:hypothetical protein